MTLVEYLDPARFPLTTEPGLSPRQQLMADAAAYADLTAADGSAMTDGEKAVLAELVVKRAVAAEVVAELRRQGVAAGSV